MIRVLDTLPSTRDRGSRHRHTTYKGLSFGFLDTHSCTNWWTFGRKKGNIFCRKGTKRQASMNIFDRTKNSYGMGKKSIENLLTNHERRKIKTILSLSLYSINFFLPFFLFQIAISFCSIIYLWKKLYCKSVARRQHQAVRPAEWEWLKNQFQ